MVERRALRALAGRAAGFALLWWALAEGDLRGWPFGLGVVAVATATSLALLPPPPWRVRWSALPSFLAYFLGEMVRGGVDVAYRALHPRLPVTPGFRTVPLRLEPLAARLCVAWAFSLLPGTVSVTLTADALEAHVLDVTQPVEAKLAALAQRLERLFVVPDARGGHVPRP